MANVILLQKRWCNPVFQSWPNPWQYRGLGGLHSPLSLVFGRMATLCSSSTSPPAVPHFSRCNHINFALPPNGGFIPKAMTNKISGGRFSHSGSLEGGLESNFIPGYVKCSTIKSASCKCVVTAKISTQKLYLFINLTEKFWNIVSCSFHIYL